MAGILDYTIAKINELLGLVTQYGSCSTAAATAAKTVSASGFKLVTGTSIRVKFNVTNTAASPTLNVNDTGAKPIMYRGAAISAGYLAANRTYTFVYDGTNYELVGDVNTNTDTKVTQAAAITTDGDYPVILAYSTAITAVTNAVKKAASLLFNPGAGILKVGSAQIKTNGYVISTWLQTTADTHSNSKMNKVAVIDGSGWIYHRTIAEVGADIGVTKNWGTFSLSADGWSVATTNGYYTQKITISDMSANYYPNIIPVWSSAENKDAEKEALCMVDEIETAAGCIIAKCTEKPAVDVSFILYGV